MQVYTQLNSLSLCTSHRRSLTLIDALGKDFDEPIRKWKKQVEDILKNTSTEDEVLIMSVLCASLCLCVHMWPTLNSLWYGSDAQPLL